MQKESSSGDRHLVGLGRAATEVSQGQLCGQRAGRLPGERPCPWTPSQDAKPWFPTAERAMPVPQTQLLGTTGSGGVRRDRGGMCPWPCPPCGRRGRGCTPGTCLWEVSGALPALLPAHGLAGGKRFAEGEGRRCTCEPRALRLRRALWDKAWRERSQEWRRDCPAGILARREALTLWHHTSVCLTQECMRSKPRACCPG